MKDDAQIWQRSIHKDVADASLPIVKTGFYARYGKRLFDLVFVIMSAPFAFMIVAFAAIFVALDGNSPFFTHPRVGKNGKIFACWKLRTMVPDADAALAKLCANSNAFALEWQQNQKLENDPRVTKLGRILRKSRIDEFPQFWNVLIGDMSLVGPRPVTVPEMARYGAISNERLAQRPGVTGLWQVSGTRDFNFEDRIALDLIYLREATFWMDIKIVALTILTVFRLNGK